MASISEANGPDLEYTRGDLAPLRLTFKKSGAAIDLTGYTAFLLSVNTELNPTDASNQVAQLAGTLDTDPTTGAVDFAPADQATSDALTPTAGLFYDVQALDASGRKVTLAKGSFTINQDITKD